MGWGWNEEFQQLVWTPDEEEPPVPAQDILRRLQLPVILADSDQNEYRNATATPTAEQWFTNPETFRQNMLLKFPYTNEAIDILRGVPLRWYSEEERANPYAWGWYQPGENQEVVMAEPSESLALHEMAHAFDFNRGTAESAQPAFQGPSPTEAYAATASVLPLAGSSLSPEVREALRPLMAETEEMPAYAYQHAMRGPWDSLPTERTVLPSSELAHGEEETPPALWDEGELFREQIERSAEVDRRRQILDSYQHLWPTLPRSYLARLIGQLGVGRPR